ncbi:hypothetical protein [Runella slithyformis]|uniref:Uncharacterized protein n=1 Tax=Runella slithyformis (strain ATCC 29530 / DSM 19594 / LMG 11500 / NCIMB 11436 / LSU 4) TaxID=761193 RepID=A0A7U3ZN55_RUNSL|nr:hypothetical protein [Runella slithyformis]AEI50269.1 hypothetical protein Runsl_3913 [Runella slithyformis DSM 19594]
MIDVNEYSPINTTEKVDAIISQLKLKLGKSQSMHFLNQLEIEICYNIRKAKIQSYFKAKFNELTEINNTVKQPEKIKEPLGDSIPPLLRDCNYLLSFLRTLNKITPKISKYVDLEYSRICNVSKRTKNDIILDTRLLLLKHEVDKFRKEAEKPKEKPSKKRKQKSIKKIAHNTRKIVKNSVLQRERLSVEPTLKQIIEERKESKRKEQEYIFTNSSKYIPIKFISTETDEDPLHRK